MKKNDGGPAFPSSIVDDSLHVPGMALRDFFASKAMQAYYGPEDAPVDYLMIAVRSYEMADAMLRAREEE